MTNHAGRARHSVRAAVCKPARSAGRGLPALPIFQIVCELHNPGFICQKFTTARQNLTGGWAGSNRAAKNPLDNRRPPAQSQPGNERVKHPKRVCSLCCRLSRAADEQFSPKNGQRWKWLCKLNPKNPKLDRLQIPQPT